MNVNLILSGVVGSRGDMVVVYRYQGRVLNLTENLVFDWNPRI
jgi:hypothetical protein